MASQMTSPRIPTTEMGGEDAHRCPCLPDTGRKTPTYGDGRGWSQAELSA